MRFLTEQDVANIRIVHNNGRASIWVYQRETTEELDARGESTIADKMGLEFRRPSIVEHHYSEIPVDDGYTIQERYEALKSIR